MQTDAVTHDRNILSTTQIVPRTPPIAAMETINPVVSLMAGFGLQSQFAVRTQMDEFEDIGSALAVDEYKIGPEVTVAAALPGSSQGVVAVSGIRRLVGGERL